MWDLIVSVPDHCLSFYLEGSRPASIFKIPASEMLIWGISGT